MNDDFLKAMTPDIARSFYGDVWWSCGELWGVMGSYGELWGVMGSHEELWGVMGRRQNDLHIIGMSCFYIFCNVVFIVLCLML
jgi:hypothetical protein